MTEVEQGHENSRSMKSKDSFQFDALRRGLTAACLLVICVLSANEIHAAPDPFDAVVILRVTFASPGTPPEIGTGFFVDHDGLIITADHVLTKYRVSPLKPPFDPGPGEAAIQIEVFNRNLPNGKVTITPARDGTEIITGRLASNRWVDLAMFRIRIDDDARRRIEPLDISSEKPKSLAAVTPWGPTCTKWNNNDCLRPLAGTRVNIQNDIQSPNEYVVTADITPGYSGGPLINDVGDVVGVCSRSNSADGPTRGYYVPIAHLDELAKVPASTFFEATIACTNVETLPVLTHHDWKQLRATFPADRLSQPQCRCCCQSIRKAPNSALKEVLAYKSCHPPWCETELLAAYIRAARIELAKSEPDLAVFKAIYTNVGSVYKDAVANRSVSASGARATAYKMFGDFLAETATNPATASSPFFFDAAAYALNAFGNAQKLNESPETYQKMSVLWERFSRDDLVYKTESIMGCLPTTGTAGGPVCGKSEAAIRADVIHSAVMAPVTSKMGRTPF